MYTTPIIPPVPKALILKELTPDKRLRLTNKGSNEIYVFHAFSAPNTMREIGRIAILMILMSPETAMDS